MINHLADGHPVVLANQLIELHLIIHIRTALRIVVVVHDFRYHTLPSVQVHTGMHWKCATHTNVVQRCGCPDITVHPAGTSYQQMWDSCREEGDEEQEQEASAAWTDRRAGR
jgi:hypothetical protein